MIENEEDKDIEDGSIYVQVRNWKTGFAVKQSVLARMFRKGEKVTVKDRKWRNRRATVLERIVTTGLADNMIKYLVRFDPHETKFISDDAKSERQSMAHCEEMEVY